MNRFALCLLGVFAGLVVASVTPPAHAEGWESIDRAELIQRSRWIGTGRMRVFGKVDDNYKRAKIYVNETIYSGIGDIETYELKVAIRDEPGKYQKWGSSENAVWFILKSGDKYEAINHPSCRADADEAKAIANQVSGSLQQLYDQAVGAAEEAYEGDGSESSDSAESIEAYRQAAEAAYAANNVPYQDEGEQSEQAWDRMNKMLETAGIESPFPKDLRSTDNQQAFFDQAKQMFGLEGTPFDKLPGPGDKGRPEFLQAMQTNVSNVVTQLVGATMGAADPSKALSEMKPIDLKMPSSDRGPGGLIGGAPQGGNPPGSSPQAPQFNFSDNLKKQIPINGSRQNMLNGGLGGLTKSGGPKPSGGGPKPSKGGGPGGPPGPRR